MSANSFRRSVSKAIPAWDSRGISRSEAYPLSGQSSPRKKFSQGQWWDKYSKPYYSSRVGESWCPLIRWPAEALILIVTFIAPYVPASSFAQDFQVSPAEVIGWAERAAEENSGLRQRLSELDGIYDVLFIPGIMGSKLKIGDFVWGASKVEADKLALDPSVPLAESPTVLETFEVRDRFTGHRWTKEDIYGVGLDQLSAALGGKEPRVFAYDWRQDLIQVAGDFHDFAQKSLQGKRVIVVAHSMGGLMFWYWKNHHQIEERPFTLLALVLLGSPLKGTCEVARMLINGYQPYPGASGFENFAYDLIFENAHGAMFTFPSVFELLWQGKSCAVIKVKGDPEDQNLLLLDFWKRRFIGRFREFAKATGMPGATDDERLKTYEDRVGNAIAKAKNFKMSHTKKQGADSVYYLFSSSFDMPMRFILKADGRSLKIDAQEQSVKGDGRVPRESAINQEFREVGTGHIFQLDAGHGELLSDPKFISVVEEIKLLFQKDKASQIAAYVASDPTLGPEFSGKRLLVSPIPSGISAAAISAEDKRAVASLNLVTAAQAFTEVSPKAPKQIGRALEDKVRNAGAARIVYKSIAVLNEDEMDARTLNRLGYIFYREGEFTEAAATLRKAAGKAEETKDPHVTDELKGKIYGNLGTALYKAGFLGEARKAYEQGTAKNNPIAQHNLNLLRQQMPPR